MTGRDEADADELLAWLAEPHRRTWLIVLDDLTDPDDLAGLWPPNAPGCGTVVTTRRRDAGLRTGRQPIDLDVFSPDQAESYLRGKLAVMPQRLDGVTELASSLGYLPLALAQAAAYILDRGQRTTCDRYRQLLTDRRRRLVALAPDALPDEHRTTVAATWALSIERADQLSPVGVAMPVLELTALLDPNGIPAKAVLSSAVAGYCTARLGRQVTVDDIEDTLHVLRRFSLLAVDEAEDTVRIHALVQRAVQDTITTGERRRLANCAAHALSEEGRADRGRVDTRRSNLMALLNASGGDLWDAATGGHEIMHQVAVGLHEGRHTAAALEYFPLLEAMAVEHLGRDHFYTLVIRLQLAATKGDATGLEEVLADMTRVLGPEHPETLNARRNLADRQGHAGRLSLLLEDCLRVQGADHPNTLGTRFHLAYWIGEKGDPAGGAAAFDALIPDLARVHGPDDANTLAARERAAKFTGEAGSPETAADRYDTLYNDRRRLLGPYHPATLQTRRDYAHWRYEAGDPARAAATLETLLNDTARALGADHPETIRTREALAGVRCV